MNRFQYFSVQFPLAPLSPPPPSSRKSFCSKLIIHYWINHRFSRKYLRFYCFVSGYHTTCTEKNYYAEWRRNSTMNQRRKKRNANGKYRVCGNRAKNTLQAQLDRVFYCLFKSFNRVNMTYWHHSHNKTKDANNRMVNMMKCAPNANTQFLILPNIVDALNVCIYEKGKSRKECLIFF